MKAIVTGMIGTYPLGGVAWDYGQYVLGMQRLGFEVTYLEDTGLDGYDPTAGQYDGASRYGVEFLPSALASLSPTRPVPWHYRGPDGVGHGLAGDDIADAVAEADLVLNVSGGLLLRPEWRRARRTVLIDTDPGWNHFVNYPRWDSGHGYPDVASFRAHDAFFTYAEAIGSDACALPTLGLDWHPTRPPVVVDAWRPEDPGTAWTTVMTWDNFRRPIEGDGVTYGTKERELLAIEHLPGTTRARLQIAVDGDEVPRARLEGLGWSIVPSRPLSRTADTYRAYVQASRGEFSVAKHVYVATGSGWFSCRSVCYLAAGRPVVLQDTGWSASIVSGEGLLAWRTLDEARDALERVESDHEAHGQAARHVAREAFAAETVLADLLERAGVG